MKSKKLRIAGLAFACAVSGVGHAALPGGISGPWFNPEQSGHGLSVYVIPGGRAAVLWHVYDPSGAPLTLYIEGDVTGKRIDGVAYAPSGMVFGEFDPATLQLPVWGEVDLEFSDCDTAVLSWRSDDPAYPAGEMEVRRLAYIDGVECEFVVENDLPAGLYQGSLERAGTEQFGPVTTTAIGIVDSDGSLWGIERSPIPGPAWVGTVVAYYMHIEPIAQNGSTISTRGFSDQLFWFSRIGDTPGQGLSISGDWQVGGQVTGTFSATESGLFAGPIEQVWTPASASMQLIAPVSVPQLVGEYTVPLRTQFFEVNASLSIDGTGGLCLRLPEPVEISDSCGFTGIVSTPDGADGVIDFQIRDMRVDNGSQYRGRGWLAEVDGVTELVLVGDDGAHGFGLIGY